uniref:Uncharacterized protein n=1 Tax=Rhizophora mucronata TaxID=61149 RepID=A0A2P2QXQ3_RHIMU
MGNLLCSVMQHFSSLGKKLTVTLFGLFL